MPGQSYQSSSVRCHLFLAFTSLSGYASAICTGWAPYGAMSDEPRTFSNNYAQVVDQLVCPANAIQDCDMGQKSYNITAARDLYTAGEVRLGLSTEEADAIFKLGQAAYDVETQSNVSSNFITLNATVSTTSNDSIVTTVEPGTNNTLLWNTFYKYSRGTLSGCSNDTLNNMMVIAAAPYQTLDQNNQTVLAGGWMSVSLNTNGTSGDATSAAVSALGGARSSVAMPLLMAILGIALTL